MKIIVLGCGSSVGVPTITGDWGTCNPCNPKNRRTRQSIAIEYNGKIVVIDTSPDIRFQLLREHIQTIDAILYTHAHADHCHGIDDVRDIYFKRGNQQIPIYGDQATLHEIRAKFPYVFRSDDTYPSFLDPIFIEDDFDLFGKLIKPFRQDHGKIHSLGFRIDDFAYSTDVVGLDEAAFQSLKGTRIWFVDCLQIHPHHTHSWLSQTLSWIERVQPEQAYLIHMNKNIDYDEICTMLPSHVRPAYDGMVVDF